MPVSCDCFLSIAKSSLENTGEQWTRNAMSRAYYFMFHAAKGVVSGRIPMTDKNGNKLRGGDHKRLSDYFCSGDAAIDHGLNSATAEKIGLKLKAAHQKRCFADYELHRHINRTDALAMITSAEEINVAVLGLKD